MAHKRKYDDCKKLGIKLYQFTDAEILKKPQIVVSMIKNSLGVSEKIAGRKTTVAKVDHKNYTEFFKANHISGSVSSKIAYGLFVGDELVACMSFNKPRYDKDHVWEIIRFASKLGVTVVGGASKLFNAFIKDHKPTNVMTYADLRFGSGEVYEKLGFDLIRQTEPGYSYHHVNGTVIARHSAQKHKLLELLGDKFDPEKSERDNMLASGYLKMFDCGHNLYSWKAA